jgi:hypothetical protein
MNEETKSFPGQQLGEKVELCTTYHWVKMIPHLVFYVFILSIIAFLNWIWFDFYQDKISYLLVVCLDCITLTIVFHLIFMRTLNYFLHAVIVTNFRIIDLYCTTLLRRQHKTIDFINIQDIEVKQRTIFERIFKYGQITLHNAAGEELFVFTYIPQAQKNYNLINHVYRRVIEKG